MKFAFAKSGKKTTDTLVFIAFEGVGKSKNAIHGKVFGDFDKKSGQTLSKALSAQEFTGKKGQSVTILAPKSIDPARIIVVGAGTEKDFTCLNAEKTGGRIYDVLKANKSKKVEIIGTGTDHDGCVLNGLMLKSYRFDKLKTKDKDTWAVDTIDLIGGNAAAQKQFATFQAVHKGVNTAKDLATLPPNILYPDSYVAEIKKIFAKLPVKLTIIDHKKAEKMGMGALMCVGIGSARPPAIVVMEYYGGKGKDVPLALVGKGITFDTGGISIKPAGGMWDMKWDMAGSAAVVGTLKALAERKAKTNVVGIVALAENMPSDRATRPGDVVKSYAGLTIEVLNTDAEGRLVLADAMAYVQEKFKPKTMIELSTLTGAIIVALGHEYAGAFSNDDKLVEKLKTSGAHVGEPVWHMPINETFEKAMVSDIADLKNIQDPSIGAGSSTAAAFLKYFVKDGVSWTHLDIAGMVWENKPSDIHPKGATGYGVRLLNDFVARHYE